MEVYRTCQFAVTVLTPATTGNGGITYRFGLSNIQSSRLFWQVKVKFKVQSFKSVNQASSLNLEL